MSGVPKATTDGDVLVVGDRILLTLHAIQERIFFLDDVFECSQFLRRRGAQLPHVGVLGRDKRRKPPPRFPCPQPCGHCKSGQGAKSAQPPCLGNWDSVIVVRLSSFSGSFSHPFSPSNARITLPF